MDIVPRIVRKIKEEGYIDNIAISSLDSYRFIQQEFINSDVSFNDKFQRSFMSFYMLNRARLTKEFRKAYFGIMQEKRNCNFLDPNDIKHIILRLYKIKNAKGLNCVHFSFTTKLVHTINNNLPIYDSRIKDFFGFRTPYNYLDIDRRVAEYLRQYEIIKVVYDNIIENNLLKNIINKFNKTFPDFEISNVKILDFIIWSIK